MKAYTLTQDELAARIVTRLRQDADAAHITKAAAEHVLRALGDIVVETLPTGRVIRLHGLGSLSVRARAARTGRNPRTNEPMDIPAGLTVRVSAGKRLKRALKAERGQDQAA